MYAFEIQQNNCAHRTAGSVWELPETTFHFKQHTPERCIGSIHCCAILCALCSSLHKALSHDRWVPSASLPTQDHSGYLNLQVGEQV